MPLPLTKKAIDIFAPTDGGGNPRRVDNGDAQVWGTELEDMIDTSLVTRVANLAALAALNIGNTFAFVEAGGYEGFFKQVTASAYSALISADTQKGLIVQSTVDATKAWLRLYDGHPKASWFGINSASANAGPAIGAAGKALAAAGKRFLQLDETVTVTTSPPKGDVADLTIIGTGRINGTVYRKRVIPVGAPSPSFHAFEDIIPHTNLRRLNRAANPVVVVVGDSLATEVLNGASGSRMNMFYGCLKRALAQQFPDKNVTFYNRAIGGMFYNSLLAVPSSWADVEWYDNGSKNWIDYVEDLEPDLVVVAFGMNHGSGGTAVSIGSLSTIRATMRSWDKAPDILWTTNMLPRLAYSSYSDADIDGREAAQGLTRTFARYYGHGLIDVGRMMMMVRDGMDVRRGALLSASDVATPFENSGTWAAYGSKYCRGYRVEFVVNLSSWSDGGAERILVKLGSGSGGDAMSINKQSGGKFGVAFTQGNTSSNLVISRVDTSGDTTTDSDQMFVVEVWDGYATLSLSNDANVPPIWEGKICTEGGLFAPFVAVSGTNANLTSATFRYFEEKAVMPVLTDTQLFVDSSYVGQNSINHPTSKAAEYIYEPVLEALNFRTELAPRRLYKGTTPVGTDAATTSKTLMSYSIPDRTLAPGLRVRLKAGGTFAANANNKIVRLYFGSVLVASLNSTFNNLSWLVESEIVLEDWAAQTFSSQAIVSGGSVASVGTGTQSITGAVTVLVSGQNGAESADDIVANFFSVEVLDD